MPNEVREAYQGSGLCPKLGYAQSGEYKGWVFAMHPDGQWVTLFQVPQPANPNTTDENSKRVAICASYSMGKPCLTGYASNCGNVPCRMLIAQSAL